MKPGARGNRNDLQTLPVHHCRGRRLWSRMSQGGRSVYAWEPRIGERNPIENNDSTFAQTLYRPRKGQAGQVCPKLLERSLNFFRRILSALVVKFQWTSKLFTCFCTPSDVFWAFLRKKMKHFLLPILFQPSLWIVYSRGAFFVSQTGSKCLSFCANHRILWPVAHRTRRRAQHVKVRRSSYFVSFWGLSPGSFASDAGIVTTCPSVL